MMHTLNDYTGSVYGGLGHLLYCYSQAKGLTTSPQLEKVQNQERFEYRIWYALLHDLQQQVPEPALGWKSRLLYKPNIWVFWLIWHWLVTRSGKP